MVYSESFYKWLSLGNEVIKRWPYLRGEGVSTMGDLYEGFILCNYSRLYIPKEILCVLATKIFIVAISYIASWNFCALQGNGSGRNNNSNKMSTHPSSTCPVLKIGDEPTVVPVSWDDAKPYSKNSPPPLNHKNLPPTHFQEVLHQSR